MIFSKTDFAANLHFSRRIFWYISLSDQDQFCLLIFAISAIFKAHFSVRYLKFQLYFFSKLINITNVIGKTTALINFYRSKCNYVNKFFFKFYTQISLSSKSTHKIPPPYACLTNKLRTYRTSVVVLVSLCRDHMAGKTNLMTENRLVFIFV